LRTFFEKRSCRRYRSKERALVAVRQGQENVYHLMDISYSGMGFRYLGKECRHKTINRVDLLYNDVPLMRDVEVQMVRDAPMTRSILPFRHCGLRFKGLSKDQQEQLEWFIDEVATVET